jgi:hypothetical protein
MKWYFPAWNGDHRLEADGERSKLIIEKPSPWEVQALRLFLVKAMKEDWVDENAAAYDGDDETISIRASVSDAGKLLLKVLKPTRETLTAIRFQGGKLEVATGSETPAVEQLMVKAEEKKAEVAVSVARPTPCCPDCVPGSVEKASEVLLEYLTPEQHAQWARHRAFDVIGCYSGHRYVLAHRHTPLAVKNTRICFDVDDGCELKFFDWSVPPEEEVLAAKLILETREHWLRNEATVFGGDRERRFRMRYKNPFGNAGDGTLGAGLMGTLGAWLEPKTQPSLRPIGVAPSPDWA